MYDPEISLRSERESKKSWNVYQETVDILGEDNDYCRWLKTINRACDTLDEIAFSIEECYDDEKKQKLIDKFKELSELVEFSVKSVECKMAP